MSPIQGLFHFPWKSRSAVTPPVVITDSTDIVCGRFVVVPFTATPFSHVWPFRIDGLGPPQSVVEPGLKSSVVVSPRNTL